MAADDPAKSIDQAKEGKNNEKDHNNFTEMKLDAEEGKEPASKFKCNECGHEVGRLADIRRHITTKHIKPQTPGNNKRGRPSEASPEKENEKKKTKENEEGTALSDITLASLDDPLPSQVVRWSELPNLIRPIS